jgi:hypothetical protein
VSSTGSPTQQVGAGSDRTYRAYCPFSALCHQDGAL